MEQSLLRRGIGPRLRALWWIQGEQDATDAAAAGQYRAALDALWTTLLATSGYSDAGMRAVIARIPGTHPSMAAAAAVRQAQADFVTERPDEAVLIDCDDLPLGTDGVHYDATGLTTLGRRLWQATPLG